MSRAVSCLPHAVAWLMGKRGWTAAQVRLHCDALSEQRGERWGIGTNYRDGLDALVRAGYVPSCPLPRCGPTPLAMFKRYYPHGRYLVGSSRHAFAIIHGKVWSTSYVGPRTQITEVVEVRRG